MLLSQAAEFKGRQLGFKIRGKINVLNKQFNFLRLTHIKLLSQMKFNKRMLFYKIHKFLEAAIGMTSAGSRKSKLRQPLDVEELAQHLNISVSVDIYMYIT